MAQVAAARPSEERRRRSVPWRAAATRVGTVLLVLAVVWGLWELYRWIWVSTGWTHPFPVNDVTMPHLHTIFQALGEPSRIEGPLLITVLLKSAWFTAREAAIGFVLGAAVG